MKKVLVWSFTLLSLILFCVSFCSVKDSQKFSVASASENPSGTFLVSQNETNTANKINFTPLKNGSERYSGTSWAPTLISGEGSQKYLNDEINVGDFFDGLNVSDAQQEQLVLKTWLYFDLHTMTDLTIGFRSEDNSKRVEWTINSIDLYNLLEKDLTGYRFDTMFYSVDNVPWGWNRLSLPFAVATTITDGLIVDGQEAGEKVLDLTTFYVYQNTDTIMSLGLNVYDLTIEKSNLNSIICEEKQPFCVVEFNDIETSGSVYVNEYFTLPAIADVFKTIWIGDTNLLSANYKNEQFYRVEVVSNGETSVEYYGKAILLENPEYEINYMIGRGNGNFVTIKNQILQPQNYGTGAWFVDDEVEIKEGEVYELKYRIHAIFKDAIIEFESTDSEVLEIVSINKSKHTITVRALKDGEAGIKIRLYDDRLLNSASEDGLENTNLVVKISKVKDQVSTVKILLWITVVMLAGLAVYYAIIYFKKSKNFEVK